jgi:hypothetical protein
MPTITSIVVCNGVMEAGFWKDVYPGWSIGMVIMEFISPIA